MQERSEQSEQSERSEPPKFGNWEGGENVEYTDYFEKAGKGRSGAKRKPNDPKEKYSNSTQSEEPSGQKLPEVVSSEHESHIDNFHHRHGGVRPRSSKFESDTPKGPVDTLKSSQEEGDMKRANDSPLRHDTVSQKATNVNSPHHRQGGVSTADGSKRTARQSMGFDRSIEHSPLHPNHQARVVNKGSGVSSPSWERKGSAEGSSHGVPPTTPGRSRLRSGTRGDETVIFLVPHLSLCCEIC